MYNNYEDHVLLYTENNLRITNILFSCTTINILGILCI